MVPERHEARSRRRKPQKHWELSLGSRASTQLENVAAQLAHESHQNGVEPKQSGSGAPQPQSHSKSPCQRGLQGHTPLEPLELLELLVELPLELLELLLEEDELDVELVEDELLSSSSPSSPLELELEDEELAPELDLPPLLELGLPLVLPELEVSPASRGPRSSSSSAKSAPVAQPYVDSANTANDARSTEARAEVTRVVRAMCTFSGGWAHPGHHLSPYQLLPRAHPARRKLAQDRGRLGWCCEAVVQRGGRRVVGASRSDVLCERLNDQDHG